MKKIIFAIIGTSLLIACQSAPSRKPQSIDEVSADHLPIGTTLTFMKEVKVHPRTKIATLKSQVGSVGYECKLKPESSNLGPNPKYNQLSFPKDSTYIVKDVTLADDAYGADGSLSASDASYALQYQIVSSASGRLIVMTCSDCKFEKKSTMCFGSYTRLNSHEILPEVLKNADLVVTPGEGRSSSSFRPNSTPNPLNIKVKLLHSKARPSVYNRRQ